MVHPKYTIVPKMKMIEKRQNGKTKEQTDLALESLSLLDCLPCVSIPLLYHFTRRLHISKMLLRTSTEKHGTLSNYVSYVWYLASSS